MTATATTNQDVEFLPPESHLVRAHGPFQLRRIRPGITLGNGDDTGFGGLGLVDHARLQPGMVVRMHEHVNDEIISYMRSGRMIHTDSAGENETISPKRLMVMNAGAGFSHEEAVPAGQPIEMLQIFVRPEEANMEPGVQFIDLDTTLSRDEWRLLVGPVGADAPAFVRQAIYLYDTHLSPGTTTELPSRPGFDRWMYVFRGSVSIAGKTASQHDAVVIGADTTLEVRANEESDLVVFLIDRKSRFSRAGTMSG